LVAAAALEVVAAEAEEEVAAVADFLSSQVF
jgi:hypothetical protein